MADRFGAGGYSGGRGGTPSLVDMAHQIEDERIARLRAPVSLLAEQLAKPEAQSWLEPLNTISRFLGGMVAGQNPAQSFVNTYGAPSNEVDYSEALGVNVPAQPTVGAALTERGASPLLAMLGELLVPDPTGARKVTDIIPLMGLLLGAPRGLQRLMAEGVHPSLLDEAGLPVQQYHGTTTTFGVPEISRHGLHGPGYYTSKAASKANQYAEGLPSSSTAAQWAPQVRLDAAMLQNPFHYPEAGAGRFFGGAPAPARVIPSNPDVAELRAWFDEAISYNTTQVSPRLLKEAQDTVEDLVTRAQRGEEVLLSHDDFISMSGVLEEALSGAGRGPGGSFGSPINTQSLMGRAFGIDGVVDDFLGEVVAFDPGRTVVNGLESVIGLLRRQGFTDEQIAIADPEAWALFQEGAGRLVGGP